MASAPVIAEQRYASLISDTLKTISSVKGKYEEASSPDKINRLYNDLSRYFRMRRAARARQEYENMSRDLYGKIIDDKEWCERDCPGSLQFVGWKHQALLRQRAIETYGIDPASNEVDILRSPTLSARARENLAKDGINLPSDWTLDRGDTFIATVSAKAMNDIRHELDKRMIEKLGGTIPPGLTFEQFETHELIQKKLHEIFKDQLGSAKIAKLSTVWSGSEFNREFLQPVIAQKICQWMQRNFGTVSSYADGGPRAEAGKDALRIVLIPPMALTISAFFTLTNVANLLILGANIFIVPSLQITGKIFSKALNVLNILLIPILLQWPRSEDIGLATQKGYQRALRIAEASSLPWLAFAGLDWAARMQPTIYPGGHAIRNWVLLGYEFPPHEDVYNVVAALDDRVFKATLTLLHLNLPKRVDESLDSTCSSENHNAPFDLDRG